MNGFKGKRNLLLSLLISILIHFALMLVPVWMVSPIFPTSPLARAFLGKQVDFTPALRCVEVSLLEERKGEKQERGKSPAIENIADKVKQPAAAQQGEVQDSREGHGDLLSISSQSTGSEASDNLYVPPFPCYLALPDLAGSIKDSLIVEIQILVGVDGNPLRVAFTDSLDQEIRAKILSAIARSRFEPARLGGVPIESWLHLPIRLRSNIR